MKHAQSSPQSYKQEDQQDDDFKESNLHDHSVSVEHLWCSGPELTVKSLLGMGHCQCRLSQLFSETQVVN